MFLHFFSQKPQTHELGGVTEDTDPVKTCCSVHLLIFKPDAGWFPADS